MRLKIRFTHQPYLDQLDSYFNSQIEVWQKGAPPGHNNPK